MQTTGSQARTIDLRFFSAILMVLGTSVGAGMLGLPVETGRAGLFPSLTLFVLTWLVMLGSGLLFAEVLIVRVKGANFISITSEILGRRWVLLTFSFYLLLFYSLITAYTKGIGTLLSLSLPLLPWQGSFAFLCCFLPFLYGGAKRLGQINGVLTLLLVLSFVLLLSTTLPYLQPSYLARQEWPSSVLALPMIISSFGFHGTLPSLVDYLHRDRWKIRWAIGIGSTLTLCVYFLWEILVLGAVPFEGAISLTTASLRDETAIAPMSQLFHNPLLAPSAQLFSLCAIITSFCGVSLGLVDFLMDAFQMEPKFSNKIKILGSVYCSAFFLSVTDMRVFYFSLNYGAGIASIFLLIFLPALLYQRHGRKLAPKIVLAFALFAWAVSLCRLGRH